ncbi:hypothetical protein AC623_18205 [Bacillus sp. FJAT-27231]|uniref:DUF927 domain-containing protein n=1 Tax=Bacillus sp. FJAT-27231 TaxID=1679168 RepID=UPI0006708804|nr:DUF927 domain-containing protein [Bacillus sp. FJAT-27231]KMY55623.1 hypothetical protein AC623_18205 [Bacillus sp. FJAT-27231]
MIKMKECYNYDLLKDTELTTLPDPQQTIQIGNYIVERNRLYGIQEDKETKKINKNLIGDLVWIDKVKRNLEKGIILFELLYYSRNQYHRVAVTRDIFNEKNIMMLTGIGADIRLENYKAVVRFLQQQEREIRKTYYQHTSLGWDQKTDSLVYYHSESLKGASDSDTPSSSYNGSLAIQPQGNLEEWKKAITEHVLGHIPLEFALVYGFTATINALLAKWRPMEVLITHIYGESSTGKTTACRLAVSSFGKPGSDGLLKAWNSTFNALMKIIGSNYGVPLVLDESSTKTNSDFTSIIYQLAEGRDKNRLNSDIELREQEKWSGAFLSTGEHRLTEKSNNNSGLIVRVPEFGSKPWTKSASHAQAIKNALEVNYGHAGPIFVQYIIDTFDKEKWLNMLDAWRDEVLIAMEHKDSFSERIAEKYAVIMMTAEVMNECFDFQIDIEGLLHFIIENDRETMVGRTLESKAFDLIEQQIIKHQSKFNQGKDEFIGNVCYGSITKKSDYLEVAILKNVMDEWLKEAQFSSTQVVLKGLKKEGILDHEQGKNTRQRKIPVSQQEEQGAMQALRFAKQTVYVLKVSKNLLEDVKPSIDVLSKPSLKKRLTKERFSSLGMNTLDLDDEDDFL